MSHQTLGEFGDFSLSVVVTSPPWYENCYLVRHRPTGTVVVVDPGDDADRILAALGSDQPAEIWLTHGHPDHLGAARALEQAFGIATRAHADEADTIARASALSRSFTGQATTGPAEVQTFAGEPTFLPGGAPVRVIHTPGHTPGGVCYDFGSFVLTGDTLFKHGVGRTDLPGGNQSRLDASITRLLGLLPDDALLFSGHGPAWTRQEARQWWEVMG